ncbi:MAG: pilus assembly protein PilM [Candidatus Moraniibacteriota bacterium]
MFELFKIQKNHFLGIDFGTSAIKVVELSYREQKINLENYGVIDLNSLDNSTKLSSFKQTLNESLGKLLVKMGIKATAAFVAVPGFSGLITIIDLPSMSQEELTKAIQFEAHKYIPSALDEIALSWEVIAGKVININSNLPSDLLAKLQPKKEAENKIEEKIKVLLVAAPKKDIEHYDRLVTGVGLEVNAIEIETFSIARALVGTEKGTFLIVDIGSRATNIILVENGIIQINRNIDAGGEEITSAIADAMKISRARAEIFKRSEKDILNDSESAIIIPVLDLIVGELRRIMSAYREKNKTVKFEAVILSGGTARMKGMEEYFACLLGEKVQMGNPWRSISIGNNEVVALTKDLGGSFTVVLGLALRGVEDYKNKQK